jgi:hypothetical protein
MTPDSWIALLVVSLAVTQAGCYPRYALVQPDLTLTVQDSSGQPISDASVFFVAASNPHHRFHHKGMYTTDASGLVHLDSQREWEFVAPIMIHGVPFYYFTWCAEKDGYRTGQGYLSATDVRCSHEETITLDPGENNGECRVAYEQLSPPGGPPPTATAGPLPAEKLRNEPPS